MRRSLLNGFGVLALAGAALLLGTACPPQKPAGKGKGSAAGTAAKKDQTDPTKVAAKTSTPKTVKPALPKAPPRPATVMPRPPKRAEYSGSHILIAYKGAMRASSKVTRTKEAAAKLAKELTAKVRKAPKTFAALAKKFSDGPSAKSGGSLGTWKKGRMVKAFDHAISALEIGAVSAEPVETKFGYHVMRRDALPPMLAGAHILVAYKGARRANPKITRTKKEALALAAKLSAQLKKDPSKFAELAATNSDGPAAKRGGSLSAWRKGSSHPVFDKVISGLGIGKVSAPAETDFGVHVFIRQPLPPRLAGSHILIGYKGARRSPAYITRTKEEAKKLAEELAAKAIKEPAKFAELALKHSDGPSMRFGGDLGEWNKGAMMPTFDAATEKLAVGAVTAEPVETPFGFHVIKRNPLSDDDKPAAKKPADKGAKKAAKKAAK